MDAINVGYAYLALFIFISEQRSVLPKSRQATDPLQPKRSRVDSETELTRFMPAERRPGLWDRDERLQGAESYCYSGRQSPEHLKHDGQRCLTISREGPPWDLCGGDKLEQLARRLFYCDRQDQKRS